MKQFIAKISLILLIVSFISSCNVVKRVGDNEHMLTQNKILVNGQNNKDNKVSTMVNQNTNSRVFGFPLRVHIYNLARDNRDSLFEAWMDKNPKRRLRYDRALSKKQVSNLKSSALGFNNWLRKTGEAPVIIDSTSSNEIKSNLMDYYFANGWFNREIDYSMDLLENKRGNVTYNITTKAPYILDSITTRIESPVIDTLYQKTLNQSFLLAGDQFKQDNYEAERERLTSTFKNSGVYYFQQDYISFENDTIDTNHKVNTEVQIKNRIIRNEDSVAHVPFKVYKIKEVNIITDNALGGAGKKYQDSILFRNYKIYSYGKMRYRPNPLTDAIFIQKDSVYKDIDRTRTYRYLNELRTFKYPNIEYVENTNDTTLTTNIYLNPRKKYGLGFNFDVSQSNIQRFGFAFSTSLSIRNIFKGSETLEISGIGSVGSSKDGGNADDRFFDIREFGADVRLIIPRFFTPFKTGKIIPKYMSPSTRLSLGFTGQTNIGLDKQTLNGIVNYRWRPSNTLFHQFDLFNIQYVNNLNPENYFNVYTNSFQSLNDIAVNDYPTPPIFLGTDANGNQFLRQPLADPFMALVLSDEAYEMTNPDDYRTVSNISERKDRLTTNNLILASNFSLEIDSRQDLFDETFFIFRAKFEFAGNLLSAFAKPLNLNQNELGQYELFGVPYSQYIKTELDYVKHWDLGNQNVFAMRTYFGIAIPYGNASSIPFTKSFFAGGANDNRAWTAYNLGPGSTDSKSEFNEANLKIAYSMEYRYNLFGKLHGALFVDVGNIWNVLDDVTDPRATFTGFESLKDIAIGSGFGLRYNFGFFVLRGDIGFKTYDPSYGDRNRWFNDYNFKRAVYNIGINYPF